MSLHRRLRYFLTRIGLLSLIAAALLAMPEIDTEGTLRFKNAIVALIFVISLGKILYDTFYFDRYH